MNTQGTTPKLWLPGLCLLGTGYGWHWKQPVFFVCFTTSYLVVPHQRVYSKIEGNPQNLGSASPHLLWVGGVADRKQHAPPHVLPCRRWSFCVKRYRHKWRSRKIASAGSPHLLVTGVAVPLRTSPTACVTTADLVVVRRRCMHKWTGTP